ncbi:MAG: tetratricopeptide repeat protein [Alphaproteobacteria bacterium]|nr:tetratricopeptide repeat protein [Alphaproteobacteria bacterium]
MNSFITFISCLIGACPAPATDIKTEQIQSPPAVELSDVNSLSESPFELNLFKNFEQKSVAGNYLAAQFAQRQHDWKQASHYIHNVRMEDQDNLQLLSKAMILNMGSGQSAKAINIAHDVLEIEDNNALALLFLAIQAFHEKDYSQASILIDSMPEDSLSSFIIPLLTSWSKAGIGEYDTTNLHTNTIHIYHAILISDLLNEKGNIERLLEQAMTAHGLTFKDIERIADIYVYTGKTNKALELYIKAYEEWPENTELSKKITALENKQPLKSFIPVKTPEQGVAIAMYEMAMLLYREQGDDSARIFANIALFLDSELTNTHFMLAHIAARNERYDEAIAHYRAIMPDNTNYLEARRLAAGLLEDTNNIEGALIELETLFKKHNDIDALIQAGDIYRRNEEFSKAIATYNHVEETLGTISKEYWFLNYVRGMSYEQNGQWNKAERDLKAALAFQPEHPLIMNYLGYAWADKGINLKQSLELIRKAASIEKSDGYIIDSLGWVLYRTGKYSEAVPNLERAVELLPYDPVINDHLGDAYWQVGRRMEARFQWLRAKNHSKDQKLSESIVQKLDSGLHIINTVKEANSKTDTDIVNPQNN